MERDEVGLRRGAPRGSGTSAPNSASTAGLTRWRSWYRIRIPKPRARRATACPIRPKPDDPERRAVDVRPHQQHRAPGLPLARRGRSGRPRRRAARRPSAAPRRGPRWSRSGRRACCRPGCRARVHAGDVDVVEADREVADDLELRPGPVEELVVDPVGEQRQDAVAALDRARGAASRGGGSSSCQIVRVAGLEDRAQALVRDDPRDEDLRAVRPRPGYAAAAPRRPEPATAARRRPGSAQRLGEILAGVGVRDPDVVRADAAERRARRGRTRRPPGAAGRRARRRSCPSRRCPGRRRTRPAAGGSGCPGSRSARRR